MQNKTTKVTRLFLAVTYSLIFCQTQAISVEVRSYPITNAPKNRLERGFAYYLPRTRLRLKYTVNLFKTAGTPSNYYSLVQSDSITLSPESVVDPNCGFFVPTARLKGLLTETQIASFGLNKGLLEKCTLSTIDRIPDILTDLGETAANVAKTIAIIAALDDAKTTNDGFGQTGSILIASIEGSQLIEPENINSSLIQCANSRLERELSLAAANDNHAPVPLDMERLFIRTAGTGRLVTSVQLPKKSKYAKGVVVRTAKPMTYSLSTKRDSENVVRELDPIGVPILQNGYLSYVPIHSSIFTDRYQKIEDDKGTLKYELKNTSAMERASKVFADVAANLLDLSKALPTLKLDVEQEVLEANTSLVNQQIKLEEATAALEEAKSETVVDKPRL